MTFWCESRSRYADPCLRLIDPDPDSDPDSDQDPAIFVIGLQEANKKLIKIKFFCLFLFVGTFTSFFHDKKSKRSHKTVEIKVFLTIFV
jgi:hypothetical protein